MLLHFKHAINIPQGMHYHALSLTIWWIQGSYLKIPFIMNAKEKLSINQQDVRPGHITAVVRGNIEVGSAVSLVKPLCC